MKTKSKSLISIILSLMMVLSMIIVAVPVNAATVDTESVGATYYIWYNNSGSNSPSNFTNKVTMTAEGSSYVGNIPTTGSNFYFLINTSSSSATSGKLWTSSPTVTKDSNAGFASWTDNYQTYVNNTGYYIIGTYISNKATVKVTFTPNSTVHLSSASTTTTYTVTKTTPTNGSFSVSPTSGVKEGDTVTISSITPASGYEVNAVTVTKSSGGTVSTTKSGSNYTFKMPASNVSVAVTFKKSSYTITKTTPANGTFDVSATSATSGTTVTISNIAPASGYEFETISVKNASGTAVSTTTVTAGSKYTFTMPASNVTVTVTFKKTSTTTTQWYISGYLSRPGETTYGVIPCGDSQFKMTQSSTDSNIYTLTYTIGGTQYYTVNDGTNVYHPAADGATSGTVASSTTDDKPGEAPSWHALDLAAGTTITLTWNASTKALSWTTVTDTTSYKISVSNTISNGTVTCATTSAKAGQTVTFTAEPNEGYVIDTVTVSGTTVSQNGTTFTFIMPAQNVTISATFKVVTTVSSKWSLVGSFNDWVITDNPMANSSGTYTTTIYLPANSTGYEFKLLNNQAASGEHAFYGKLSTNYTDTISNAVLDNTDSVPSTGNVLFKTTGGVYTFKFVESTHTLTVTKASTYTLTATGTIPDTIGAGEDLNMTIKAVPSSSFPTTAYYKYTVLAGSTYVAKGVQYANTSYNCKTTLSADTTMTYYVKAYNASGELLGLTATGSKDVEVTVGDFTVEIKSDNYEISLGNSITLSAVVTPSNYAGSYEFFVSEDGDTFTSIGTSTTATKKITCSEVGRFYYKVVVTNKYDTTVKVESYQITINVYESIGKHSVDIYFKSASSFIYAPTLNYEGVAYPMSKDFAPVYENGKLIVQPFIGNAYSGSLKYYWYKATVTLDSSKANTLTFTAGRTQLNASFTGKFHGSRYFMAADNLMNDKVAVDLTNATEFIRNFYHSPLNMTSVGDISDANLGFTNVGGTTYKMGSYLTSTIDVTGVTTINASFSIKSATAAQKVSAELEDVSDLQYGLLDVNLDGNVDVRDATLMQKALASA